MSISDMLRKGSGPRQARSGLSSAPVKKLREWDDQRNEAFSDENIGPLGVLFCVLMISACVFILDKGVLPPAYKEGTRPPVNVHSRLNFDYSDPNELSRIKQDAAEMAPRVYVEDPNWIDDTLHDLVDLIGIVEVAQSADDARDRAARFPGEQQLIEELYKYNQDMGALRNPLRTLLLGRIRSSLQALAENGILSKKDLEYERNKRGEHREIVRLTPPPKAVNGVAPKKNDVKSGIVPMEWLRSVEGASDELMRARWKESLPRSLERQLYAHLHTRLKPNLELDVAQTELRREAARQSVGTTTVQVKQNDLLLSKDRPILKGDLDKLYEENRAFKRGLPWDQRLKHQIGMAAVVFSVLLVFLFVVSRTQRSLFRRRRAMVMLGIFSVAVLAICRALMLTGHSAALTPFVFLGIVASLAFGQTVSVLTLFALSVLTTIAGIRWQAIPIEAGIPAISMALLAGGVAASLPAQRLRDRWDLLKYGAIGGLVQGILVAGMAWLGEGLLNNYGVEQSSGLDFETLANLQRMAQPMRAGVPTLYDALLALINGPICGLLLLGSLPLIESLFGILTNIRLFELADMNRPALRRIQLEAPGTFAHTLQVRFLAEPASDAIGANTRLISAGVLYHDLGKVLKPEYFVENQMDAGERHRRLRPSVSALLITSHVKDGIELANEYGLPKQIIDFIPEHHGTTLVSYFYHNAMKNAESEEASGNDAAADSVHESFFRYPGPKPQSKETAIVMLADTVEAASRTLENPSPSRLTSFVHELIMDKMMDGQLDECTLTFAEVAQIEQAFVRVLVTRFHSRIRYPGQEEQSAAPSQTTTVVEVPANTTPPPAPPIAATTTVAPVPSSRREVLTETRMLHSRESKPDDK